MTLRFALALAVTSLVTQQTGAPRTGTGLLMGRVIDADTRRPVSDVAVSMTGVPGPSNARLTDDEGRFVFMGVQAARIQLNANRVGYLRGSLGARRAEGDGQAIQLADGQRIGNLEILIWREAAISGTVLDEAGEPVVNDEVRAFRRRTVAGRVTLVSGGSARTDDRGMYRLSGLEPGEWVVAVPMTEAVAPLAAVDARGSTRSPLGAEMTLAGSPLAKPGTSRAMDAGDGLVRDLSDTLPTASGSALVYRTTYAPSAVSVDRAEVIAIEPGEERGGADIRLQPVPAVRVSGRLVGPDGPAPDIAVRLFPAASRPTSRGIAVATTISTTGGAFTFAGVPSGEYRLSVLRVPRLAAESSMQTIQTAGGTRALAVMGTAPVSPDPTWWAEVPLTVGSADASGLEITLATGQRVRGHVEYDGTPPPNARLTVYVEAADGSLVGTNINDRLARVETDGTFFGPELPPGDYFVRAPFPPAGWQVESVMAGGRDVSETPLALGTRPPPEVVVRFTRESSSVSGRVRDADGLEGTNATVLVFPTDRSAWTDFGEHPPRFRSVRVDRRGGFTIDGLPPGDYAVLAVEDDRDGEWQVASVLDALVRLATPVTIGARDRRSIDLQIVRAR